MDRLMDLQDVLDYDLVYDFGMIDEGDGYSRQKMDNGLFDVMF